MTHVTIGRKVRRGRCTGLSALKVHVTAKAAVRRRASIPRHIAVRDRKGRTIRFRTDVVDAGGCPTLFGVQAGHRVLAFDQDLGVVGFTFAKGERRYVLTNAHVVCDVAQEGATGATFWLEHQGAQIGLLGSVLYWTPLRQGKIATSDAAVIAVDDPLLVEPGRVSGIAGSVEFMGMLERKRGPYWLAFEGDLIPCTDPEPVIGDVPIAVDGTVLRYSGFWQLKSDQGRASKGMSGAVLLRDRGSGMTACGLVFGGVSGKLIFAYSFRPLFERAYSLLPS